MNETKIEYKSIEWKDEALEYLNDKIDYYILMRKRDLCSKHIFLLSTLACISYICISIFLRDFCVSFFIGAAIILICFILIFLNIFTDLYCGHKLRKYEKDHKQIKHDLSKCKNEKVLHTTVNTFNMK